MRLLHRGESAADDSLTGFCFTCLCRDQLFTPLKHIVGHRVKLKCQLLYLNPSQHWALTHWLATVFCFHSSCHSYCPIYSPTGKFPHLLNLISHVQNVSHNHFLTVVSKKIDELCKVHVGLTKSLPRRVFFSIPRRIIAGCTAALATQRRETRLAAQN